MQDDWYSFLDALKAKDLAGKKVAIFGCGDSGSYPDTFCDAVGLIYDGLQDTGCTFVGSYAPAGYGSIASLIVRDGKFVGLAIDESDPGKPTNGWRHGADRLKTSSDERRGLQPLRFDETLHAPHL